MSYADMDGFTVGRLLFLPTVTINMKDSENYKFVVFARKKFIEVLKQAEVKYF